MLLFVALSHKLNSHLYSCKVTLAVVMRSLLVKLNVLYDTGVSFLSAGDKPVFLFRGTTYQNNSLVTLENLGEGDDALHCITNDTDCCVKAFIREGGVEVYGNWYYPNHTRVPSVGSEWDFFRTRGESVVNLHRRRGGDIGIYRCQLPYVTNDTAYLYIGVYTATTGE